MTRYRIGDWVAIGDKGRDQFNYICRIKGADRGKVRLVGRKYLHISTPGGYLLKIEPALVSKIE